ncbi:MAG: response regulator [Gemmatimonas sp.]|nr:response regulator [Gemmatimonas sp.]
MKSRILHEGIAPEGMSARDPPMPLRVYIVEDDPTMREMLADFLARNPEIELCGARGSAEEALLDLPAAYPSVVLVDLSLPGRSGLELLCEINERWDVPCLVLSGHRKKDLVDRALAAGARGYVLKDNPLEIPGAIRQVMQGEIYLSTSLSDPRDTESGDPLQA